MSVEMSCRDRWAPPQLAAQSNLIHNGGDYLCFIKLCSFGGKILDQISLSKRLTCSKTDIIGLGWVSTSTWSLFAEIKFEQKI